MEYRAAACSRHLSRATLGLAAALLPGLPLAAQRASLPPPVEVRIPKPPTLGRGDGRQFLVYELHVTNLQGDTLVLKSIDVLGENPATPFATYADSALVPLIARPGLARPGTPPPPPADRPKIGGGLRAVVFMWVPVAEGTQAPRTLRHRLTFAPTGSDSARLAVAETAPMVVATDAPLIGPPLRGGPWLAANGPANNSGHRRAMIPIDALPRIAQRFAIDYIRVNDTADRRFVGDSLKNASYIAYGNDALAVADGRVVAVKDSIPENVPGITSRAVPITLETVGGNHVIIDIGGGHYAFYAHLQPGSIRVRVGDRVRTGQVLGLVGNSGNSTEPHLHFHVSDGNSPLGSEGVPYMHQSLQVLGTCRTLVAGCSTASPTTLTRSMPMANQLVRYP
jgi:Peptidase family M23